MPDATQSVDWNVNAPIMSPDGNLHAIPKGLIPQALAQPGAKRAIPMLGTDGTHRWIPEDQLQPAVQAGARISWPSQQIPKWFGFTPGNVASNAWSGAKGLVGGLYDLGSDLVNNPDWFEGKNSTYQKFIGAPAEQQVVKAGQALNAGKTTEALGHGLASAVPMIGPWAAGLGEQAGTGDVGGAAGQAAGTVATGAALANAPAALNKIIPSKTRAGLGLQGLTDAPDATYAQHPVETPKALKEAKKIETQLNVTGEKPPPLVQHYLGGEQLRNVSPEFMEQLRAQGIEPAQPMTMYEARTTLKRVNEAIGDFNLGGSVRNAYKRFAGALDEDISNAANAGGFGKQYASMRNEYKRGSQAERIGDEAGPMVGGAIGATLGRNAGNLAMAEATGAGMVAGRYLGKPIVGSMVRSVVNRQGAPVSSPPALPPIPRTSEEYLRTMLAAKEGTISPGEMERRLKRGGAKMRMQPLPSPPQ